MIKRKSIGIILWIIFIVAFVLTTIYSTKTGLHDADEYINVAKELSGIHNVKVFSAHSIVYSLFIAQFLKIFPSLITIKLIGVLWFILDGLLLYFILKSKKAFLIWMLSPIVWINIVEVSPILPISFFALLSYLYFKKWEETNKKSYFAISALLLGLCFTLWEAFIINFVLFILIFFWNKNFKIVFLYLILTLPTIAIRFITDQIYFGFPLTSLIRYIGSNVVITLGYTNPLEWPNLKLILATIFLIAPLLFMIYKTDFKKYKREFWFAIILLLFFMFRGAPGNYISTLKYYLPFSPILIILLAKTLNKKLILINSIISIGLIIFFLAPFMQEGFDSQVEKDLNQIKKDFNFKEIIAGKDHALIFATHSWTGEPKFIWWEEYELTKKNERYFSKYSIETKSKINQLKILELQAGLKRTDNKTYEGLPILTMKGIKNQIIPKEYKLTKEYNILQLYTS